MPSTVIKRSSWDDGVLKIIFISGIKYLYKDVPEKVYREMKEAYSKGIYFNQHIKNRYLFEKVEE